MLKKPLKKDQEKLQKIIDDLRKKQETRKQQQNKRLK